MINIIFAIINQGKKAITAKGSYTLGIFSYQKENYASIEKWLTSAWNDLKVFTSTQLPGLDEIQVPKYYYFAADWKATSNVLGLKAANSNWPCLYCKIKKCDLHLILEPHQIQFRSYEEQLKILEDPNFGKKKFC